MASLHDIFAAQGELVEVEGNRPLLLSDKDSVWLVKTQYVDVFYAQGKSDSPDGPRTHLFRTRSGGALIGVDAAACGVDAAACGGDGALLATGLVGTELLRLSKPELTTLAQDSDLAGPVAEFVDSWIARLSAGLCVDLPPKQFVSIEPGVDTSMKDGASARPRRGVLWTRQAEGVAHFIGRDALGPEPDSDALVPVTSRTWLSASGDCRLGSVDTPALVEGDGLWRHIDAFHELAMRWIALNQDEAESRERARLEDARATDARHMESAIARLTSVLRETGPGPLATEEPDAIMGACQLVGNAIGVEIRPHPDMKRGRQLRNPLQGIVDASGLRMRRVMLRADWWRRDNGPLLGFREDGKEPVALLPRGPNTYEAHDPIKGTARRVNAKIAAGLDPAAYSLYRPFPNGPVGVWDLFRVGAPFRWTKDVVVMAAMGVLAGLLGLFTPFGTGLIFDTIIPSADPNQLLQITVALVVSAIAITIFNLTQSIAMLRITTKTEASAQAAIWDRLLSLPAPFFREYSAGDLANRAMSISAIRQYLSGAVVRSFMTTTFSVFNLGLLFYYSWRLALAALGIVLLAFLITGTLTFFQARRQRTLVNIQGKIAGMVLQFITGVAKIRVAGAEKRVFGLWAAEFDTEKETRFRAECISNIQTTLISFFPLAASMIIFYGVIYFNRQAQTAGGTPLSAGQFVAFNVAFMTFLTAMLGMSEQIVSSVINVIPVYERLKPLLLAQTEVDESKADPGELTGQIEVQHVCFSYGEDGPMVLDDVSLQVAPGEFVAIVGPSGSGKSTLFRLLMGFEAPSSGTIYYDGQDVATVDVRALRRQLGVVLQNSQVMAGDIHSNIAGASVLTPDEVQEAIRMAGLEEDIKAMPMGVHTVLTQGGTTLSGGQRQRIVIARAIAKKPRIVYFDEATSALDNRTQAIVSESLEHLHVTRVVIAHRLSTIRHADRIYVLRDGKIVQSGTYDELMKEDGPFAELAKRQMA